MENLLNIWQEASSHLENTLPESKKQWIRKISFEKEENGKMILSLSSAFYKETTEKNCKADIENTVAEISGREIPVEFVVNTARKPSSKTVSKTQKKEKTEPVSKPLP